MFEKLREFGSRLLSSDPVPTLDTVKQNGRCGHSSQSKTHHTAYDSAEARVRMEDWRPRNEPPHITSVRERSLLVARSQDLERNSELVSSANQTKLDLALGVRYRMKPTPCVETLGFTGENAACDYADWQHMVRTKFEKQMYGGRNWIDARGMNDLQGILRLYSAQDLTKGESIATIFRRRSGTGAPFRTVVNVLDTEKLRTPQHLEDQRQYDRGLTISEGVLMRFATSAPVGYYLHSYHPFDSRLNGVFSRRPRAQQGGGPVSTPLAAGAQQSDPYQYINRYSRTGRRQVVHTLNAKQPGMVRGIMQIAACMKTLKCMDRFTMAQIESAILQSLVAFTVESDIPNAVQQMLGAVQDTHLEAPMVKAAKEYQEFKRGFQDAGNKLTIDNTIVPHLLLGERLNMQGLNINAADYSQFMDVMFTLVARCCGISKEYLTQDWSKTSYSGARAGMLVVYRDIENFRARSPMVLAQAIYACWLEDCILDGEIPLPGFSDPQQAWLYFVANRQMLSGSTWRGPAKDEIDRAKVASWFIGEQQLGVYTVERYCDEVLSTYWEDVAEQQALEEVRWNKIREKHGLAPLPPGMLHSPSAQSAAMIAGLNPPQTGDSDNSGSSSNNNNSGGGGGNNRSGANQ